MITRVIIEPAACDGPTNMARDEILLEQADRFGMAAIRWYRWSPATVSLGYFQTDEPATLPELARVRRLSGGGAILHDAEWTYSLSFPRSVVGDARALYAIVHNVIVSILSKRGLDAAMRGIDCPEIDGEFLCFNRGDRHDIVATSGSAVGRKIVGSAQRRRGTAVLQHGSIALDTPLATRDGSESTIRSACGFHAFCENATSGIVEQLDLEVCPSTWSAAEVIAGEQWAREKYSTLDWTKRLRRGPELTPNPSN